MDRHLNLLTPYVQFFKKKQFFFDESRFFHSFWGLDHLSLLWGYLSRKETKVFPYDFRSFDKIFDNNFAWQS